ncbi:hypothetical protein DKK71_09430 [Snodgrassella alvi]|uniref:hypothetical protein n=1 Tax=Snodgrassella alvi TaxID=1196083 RepID=UPI000D783661|nr:hypothetical protein [Snodgrassella alvi]PXY96429.1 hypothetical protein DKK71_09430 [Snodgrassella alvi]
MPHMVFPFSTGMGCNAITLFYLAGMRLLRFAGYALLIPVFVYRLPDDAVSVLFEMKIVMEKANLYSKLCLQPVVQTDRYVYANGFQDDV